VEETLSSVQAQTSEQWECLVVDDSQREEPPAELASFFEDARFTWLKRKGAKGANGGRNTGLRSAKYHLVSFLDDDDIAAPQYVQNRIDFVKESRENDFWIFPNYSFRLKPGDLNAYACFPEASLDSDLERLFKVEHPWITSGPLWRKSFLEDVGRWNEELTAWQDWELNVRALLRSPRYKRSQVGDNYRRKGGFNRKTISSSKRGFHEMETIWLAIEDLYQQGVAKELIGREDRWRCLIVFLEYSSIRVSFFSYKKIIELCLSEEVGVSGRFKGFLYFFVRKLPILKEYRKTSLLLPCFRKGA
jgi:glycosyltransferase involved in cell wall biosynthesis